MNPGYKGEKACTKMGQRTNTRLKLKPERDNIDCTTIKALYGKRRRAGLSPSFLLAVQDPKEEILHYRKGIQPTGGQMEILSDIIEQTRTNHDDEGAYIKPPIGVEATNQEDSGNERIHKRLRPESVEDHQIPTRQKHPRN